MRAGFVVVVVALAACGGINEPPRGDYMWSLPAGLPIPRVPAHNPMSADKVELGRYLFHDTQLSRDGSQSCASCHDVARAFTDGRVTPTGVTGEHGRHNAMSLVNVAYNSSSTWASHVESLEAQALLPMVGTTPIELGLAGSEADLLARLAADSLYAELFARAFPETTITVATITHALASFERTILSGDSPFDRFIAGDTTALDAPALRGLSLFESERLACSRCHGGFNLASSYDHSAMIDGGQVQLFNTGLYNVDGAGAYPADDRGLIEVTGDPRDMGRFRAPTLRNIALTAPYFHDGSAATLDAVIDHYATGGIASPLTSTLMAPGFTLTVDERADLVAFLGALTDPTLAANPTFATPF
jgi:cytochrome c peroxidase